jgi:hypothetical protein
MATRDPRPATYTGLFQIQRDPTDKIIELAIGQISETGHKGHSADIAANGRQKIVADVVELHEQSL